MPRVMSIVCLPLALAGPVAAEDRFFDSAGVRIRYVEEGRGEPVVLVHGYTSDIEGQWIETGVAPALARHHRVIAFDARGHGKSGKPHDPRAYGPEMARDVVRLLDHLGIAKAHVVGYSMGAHIVAQLLTLHPERFLSATLGGASGRRNWSTEDDRRVAIESAEMDEGRLSTQILRLWPADRPRPDAAQIAALSAEIIAGRDRHALAAVRRSNREQAVTAAQMAAVKVPVLGIVGSADAYRADFDALKALMPRMQLVVIEGATHGSAPGHPEFLRALSAFLRAHAARPRSDRGDQRLALAFHISAARELAA